jgi:signal transduction histidine kinase
MSYYLRHLNKNVVFIEGFFLFWAFIFLYKASGSPVLACYGIFSILFIIPIYLHKQGKNLATAVSFIAISDLTLLLTDPGFSSPIRTGVGYLYMFNILYAFAFLLEDMDMLFYITMFSTGALFCLVNYTQVSPGFIGGIDGHIPAETLGILFIFTTVVFFSRLCVLLYTMVSHFINDRINQEESEFFFANLDEPICILDKDFNLKRFNNAFELLYKRKYTSMPSAGMSLGQVNFENPTHKKFERFIRQSFSGTHLRDEFHFTLEDSNFIFEISLFPIMNRKGLIDRVGLIYRDITARKKIELDIVYTQNGLLEMIVHDLKAPLAMIKNVNAQNKDQAKQYHDFIDRTCVQANLSIDHILAFSKYIISSDPSGYKIENLGKVLADKINEIAPNAMINGQNLILERVARHFFVKMNADAFGRAIDNIINNSIKFTEGHGEISLRVAQQEDDFVQIMISDQGIGIPQGMHKELFEKFSKAGRSGVNGESSNGLGLHIADIIIKLHGGNITLAPIQSVGSTFVITLPLV